MLLGTLAVASPILIHLLNKRRFKIVNWAAMDFLFQADKKNRRRVQLENFILLLLRCLAMLLLALMLARPFLPSNITAILAQAQKVERVILIDDSLSQRVLNGTQPSIDVTKESLKNLLAQLAGTTATEDWLTVILASQPEQRLIDNEPLTATTLNRHQQTIDGLESADRVADYTQALTELKTYIGGDKSFGRAAYIYTDLRQRDWQVSDQNDENSAPNKLLDSIADIAVGTFVIDVAGIEDQNLAITNIRSDGLLVANKVINFIVDVANFGDETVTELKVYYKSTMINRNTKPCRRWLRAKRNSWSSHMSSIRLTTTPACWRSKTTRPNQKATACEPKLIANRSAEKRLKMTN